MNEQKLTYEQWRAKCDVIVTDSVRQALKELCNSDADAEVERAMRKEYEFYLTGRVEP